MGNLRLLDLFCGAGGAAVGYHRAGFTEIVGVDIADQPHYPFDFVQADALEYVAEHGREFDVIHASPPCQGYSIARNNGQVKKVPKLVKSTRKLLVKIGKPWVIENVPGAPMPAAIVLCGASFGLGTGDFDLARHRLFESNILILSPPCQHKRGMTIGVYGNGTNAWHREKFGRNIRAWETREAMGIDWMTRKELNEAIPPAYTEYIGRQLIKYLERANV